MTGLINYLFVKSVSKDKESLRLGELLIVIITCTLLSIWAVKGTIALRNNLIGLGLILSLIYFYANRHRYLVKDSGHVSPVFDWLPLIFLYLMFVWVVVHYFIFSWEPTQQLRELTSTWLRSFCVVPIGLAIGQIIKKTPNTLFFLGFSLASSFLVLLYEYVPQAINTGKIFLPMFNESIYRGKINAVLTGTMALTLMLSGVIHYFTNEKGSLEKDRIYLVMTIFFLIVILFSFANIIDTRNGMGISFIILTLFLGMIFIIRRNQKYLSHSKKLLIYLLITLLVLGSLIYNHLQKNSGWKHYFEDVVISAQIDRYPHWQNLDHQYPRTETGRVIPGNTYERTAWAVAGAQILLDQPTGYGLLSLSFGKWLKQIYPNATAQSTHSAWLDLGLAFGWPALLFSVGSITLIIYSQYRNNQQLSKSIILLCVAILIIWFLGEVNAKHSIELLYFYIALICSINFACPKKTTLKINA